MAKKKVPAVEPVDTNVPAQPADAAATAPAVEQPAKSSKTEVTVKYRDHKGEPTERTFSKEVHGDDFAKLAEEFRQTNAASIIAD